MKPQIPLSDLDYGPEEEQAVLDVIRSRWLTMGEVTQEFEQTFAKMLGVKHALAVSNGTDALHLACLSLGIGPGDEVICPSLTFVATANAVLYTGANVRFADIISPKNLTISPAEIEQLVNSKTKAIMVMHYGGYPCLMAEIMEIARRKGLTVIEDAAHAPGASLGGRSLGTWGDVGCFSFFSNKNLAVGEGGMVVTNRDDLAEKIRLMRSHGMTSLSWDRYKGHAFTYDVVALGHNDRSDEIHSALGLVQLKKLKKNNERRKAITKLYHDLFNSANQSEILLPFEEQEGEPAYHIFPLLLPEDADRQNFMQSMRDQGVQTSIHYPPIHTFTFYRDLIKNLNLPITENIARREVTLPLYPTILDDDIKYIFQTSMKALYSSRK